MATDPRLCLNPRCETDDPIRSFLNPFYCGGPCEYAHKQLLRAGPPRREDVVRVPVQEEYARVADSYRRLWNDGQAAGPQIVHPAGVIPADVEQRVSEDLARKAAAMNLVNTAWGAADAVGVPPSTQWRVDRGFLARLRKRWLG